MAFRMRRRSTCDDSLWVLGALLMIVGPVLSATPRLVSAGCATAAGGAALLALTAASWRDLKVLMVHGAASALLFMRCTRGSPCAAAPHSFACRIENTWQLVALLVYSFTMNVLLPNRQTPAAIAAAAGAEQ